MIPDSKNEINRFWSKAAPQSEEKTTQSFNNTNNNIQTQQQTFKMVG
jgi:hypothetical protein